MTLAKALQAAAGNTPAGDLAAAIDFDGTNDYLSRASDLTGNADGKTFTFSAWIYETSGNSKIYHIDNGSGSTRFQIAFDGTGASSKLEITGTNASGTTVLNIDSLAGNLALNTWQHILVSIDLTNSSNRHIYINGVSQTVTWNTYSNDNIDFTSASYLCVGAALYSGGSYSAVKGRLSNVFLDYTYRDLSVTNNRRLFITEDGKPADGQASLNPIMYMPLDDPEDIGYNAGTGGDFTVNGVMARSGRGPNQDNCSASTFDGSADYLSISAITGASNSKFVTFNAVFKKNFIGGTTVPILFVTAIGWTALNCTLSNGAVTINMRGNSASALAVTYDNGYPDLAVTSVSMSVDLNSALNRSLFINGIDVTASATWGTYDLTQTFQLASLSTTENYIGRDGSFYNQDIGEVYVDDSYIDLATSNPFWDSDLNKPVSVRKVIEDTGVTPLIALPIIGNDAGNNLGTGGDFTVNSGPFTGARGPSEFIGRSATFADNKSLERSSLGTLSDGKVFYIAFAVKPSVSTDSNTGNIIYFADSATNDYFVIRKTETQDNLELVVRNGTTATDVNRYASNNNALSSGAWHTVLFTDDLSVTNKSKRELWINGTKINSWTENVNSDLNIPFSSFDSFRVSNSSFSAGIQGSIGFLAFDTTYLDFSQEANRLKFFDAFGYPVDLGEDGSTPTGSQPLIYINNDFHLGTNLGSGGGFTPTNTPTVGPDVGS